MNKSHITSDQVKSVLQMYWHADDPSKIFSNVDIQDMRRALESAFPDPSIQELIRDEERSARHDDTQQPAAFKPIAFADQDPPNGSSYWGFETHVEVTAYYLYHEYDCKSSKAATHWLPASSLPIPSPSVDSKEQAWLEFVEALGCETGLSERALFRAGYEAAQAGGAK